MDSRNISFHQGYNALFVVNPNNLSSERARLVIGFPGRTVEAIRAWLEAFHPRWFDVSVVTDEQIREHSKVCPLPE